MQVVKITVLLALGIGMLLIIGCVSKPLTAEQAREVNFEDYGSLDTPDYEGFKLEDFMGACGSAVVFQNDGANIIASCNDWAIHIETYSVESGFDEPYWCTQVTLSNKKGSTYAFGHLKNSMPRVVSQPERILVRDASPRPWLQRIEKATLEDLIELMTSGNLWEERNDPLEGLSFSYLETDVNGISMIHHPDPAKRSERVSGASSAVSV